VGVFAADDPDGALVHTFGPILKKEATRQSALTRTGWFLWKPPISSIIKAWKDAELDSVGNAPGPFFGAAWKQCASMGFKPKIVDISRGALSITTWRPGVVSFPGRRHRGLVGSIDEEQPGHRGTTPQSLADRWVAAKNQPELPNIVRATVRCRFWQTPFSGRVRSIPRR